MRHEGESVKEFGTGLREKLLDNLETYLAGAAAVTAQESRDRIEHLLGELERTDAALARAARERYVRVLRTASIGRGELRLPSLLALLPAEDERLDRRGPRRGGVLDRLAFLARRSACVQGKPIARFVSARSSV